MWLTVQTGNGVGVIFGVRSQRLTSSVSKSSPTTVLIPSAVRKPFPSRSSPSNACAGDTGQESQKEKSDVMWDELDVRRISVRSHRRYSSPVA